MSTLLIVTAGVLIFGRVAAQHLAARLANSQMHPAIVDANALLTPKYRVIGF
jgi:hypothetical protein